MIINVLILFLTFLLNSKFLYSGSNLSRFDVCQCGDYETGGMVPQGEFMKDVEHLEQFAFKMNVGNLIEKSDFENLNLALSLLDVQGYDLFLLGPNEAEMLPEDIFSESLKHDNVEIIMSTSIMQDIPRYKIVNWDGQDVLVLSIMDPIQVNPGWGYIQPEEALNEIFLETQGLYDLVVLVSWLDTFRNRDIIDQWPGTISFLIEAQYDFEGIEMTFDNVPIVGLSQCSNLQLVHLEDSFDLISEKEWRKVVIDLGEGYSFEDIKDSYRDFLLLSDVKPKEEKRISSFFPLDFIQDEDGDYSIFDSKEKELGYLLQDDAGLWLWSVQIEEELIVSDKHENKEKAIDDLKVFLVKHWIISSR